MRKKEYGAHGFEELEKLYEEKPYQGQRPAAARVVFLGRDANYPQALDDDKYNFFKYILEYHNDGVAFWKNYNIHHPFLHPDYPCNKSNGKLFKDGIKYHKVFAKMGLDSRYAEYISFMEILNKATCGNTGEDKDNWFYENIEDAHIKMLEEVFLAPGERIVFIPKTVLRVDLLKVKKKTGRFGWLLDADRQSDLDEPCLILKREGTRFYKCSHFSGAISNKHLGKIGEIVREFVDSASNS